MVNMFHQSLSQKPIFQGGPLKKITGLRPNIDRPKVPKMLCIILDLDLRTEFSPNLLA